MEWISTTSRLPQDEEPVLVIVKDVVRIGERRWEHPHYEDNFEAYWYWDDPNDDGQDWEREDVTHWMPIPRKP